MDNEDFDLDFNLTQKFVEISFKSSALPDFEAPADDNGDRIYSVKITAKDIDGLPITTQLDFNITNVDDSPTFSNSINFSPQVMENRHSFPISQETIKKVLPPSVGAFPQIEIMINLY